MCTHNKHRILLLRRHPGRSVLPNPSGISVLSLIRYQRKPIPFGSWKNLVPRYFGFGIFGSVPVNTESIEQHVISG